MARSTVNRKTAPSSIIKDPTTALACTTLTGLTNVSTGTGTYSLTPNGPLDNNCISMSSSGADISRFDYVLPTPLSFSRGIGVFVNYDALPESVRYGTPYTALTLYVLPVAGSFANYSTFSISPQYFNGVYGSGPKGWMHIQMDYNSVRKAGFMSGVVNFNNPMQQIRLATTTQYPLLVSNVHALGYNRPRIALTFDDGQIEDYTVVFPLLTARGLVGTTFIVEQLLNGTAYLSFAQLQEMYDAGWDVGCHGDGGDSWITSGLENRMRGITKLISDKGWLRAAKIGASPGGAYSEKMVSQLISQGFTRCFRTGPSTIAVTNNYQNAIAEDPRYVKNSLQKYFMYRQYCQTSTGDTSTSTITQIDNAIKTGVDLTLGFHKIDAGGTGQGWSTTNFVAVIDALAARVKAGLCDVVRVSDL